MTLILFLLSYQTKLLSCSYQSSVKENTGCSLAYSLLSIEWKCRKWLIFSNIWKNPPLLPLEGKYTHRPITAFLHLSPKIHSFLKRNYSPQHTPAQNCCGQGHFFVDKSENSHLPNACLQSFLFPRQLYFYSFTVWLNP